MLQKILGVCSAALMAAGGSAHAQQPHTYSDAKRSDGLEMAVFAGGCFWCMEPQFSFVDGVKEVLVGYTGGTVENPTYEQVSKGNTGHVEAISVLYDPAVQQYETLLDIFWKNIDPLDPRGQFCDKGSQYAAGIFTVTQAQEDAARASLIKVQASFGDKKVATFIRPASAFYAAEDYHQQFFIKNKQHYEAYANGCGRKETLKERWKK